MCFCCWAAPGLVCRYNGCGVGFEAVRRRVCRCGRVWLERLFGVGGVVFVCIFVVGGVVYVCVFVAGQRPVWFADTTVVA